MVHRDRPGRLEKTGVVSEWMKKDRGWEKNIQERRGIEEALLEARIRTCSQCWHMLSVLVLYFQQ